MSSLLTHWVVSLLGHVPPIVWNVLWLALYALGTLLLLWALSLVKNIAGWLGVVLVLLAVTYGFAYARGYLHQSINPFDNPVGAIIQELK